ncbi:MAG TPA: OmpA family protein [Nitrospiraceae bacterium]|nr:OmpA family protein [Nitrospiraceae bacterium]
MTQTAWIFTLIVGLYLNNYTVPRAFGESESGKPVPSSPPAKEAITNGGEAPKESREADDSSNRLNLLKLERDLLQSKVDDLQRQLETLQQDLAGGKKALTDVSARVAALEKEKNQIAAALTEAKDQARDQATKLAAEQVKSATLREDKQRLMNGTTTAKEEIARLQKRAGELETEAARADDLAKRLGERDQEIERLRKAAADRESLSNKVAALTDKLERSKQRVTALTEELAARSEEAARARQERDQLALDTRRQQDSAKDEGGESMPLPARAEPTFSLDRDAIDKGARERVKLEASLHHPDERPVSDESVKAGTNGAEGKSAAKEPPASRLTAAHHTLSRSLEADIAKGDLIIQNGRDRLTIMMADRALFEPGMGQMKPDGVKLLKKVSEALKTVSDKHIRIEHHPNEQNSTVPKDRSSGAWELSMARAGRIVQHLLDEGAVDPTNLAVASIPDVRQGAGTAAEEGRSLRHTEIIVSLKN